MSRRNERQHSRPQREEPRAERIRERKAREPCEGDKIIIPRRAILLGLLGVAGIGAAAAAPKIYDICCLPVCSTKPPRVHGILVDCSDEPLPGSQDRGFDRLAEKFMEVSRMGDRAIVARLLDDAANPTEILKELCDPGRSSEKSALLNTYDPEDKERKTSYLEPWKAAVQTAKKPSPQAKTPLVEGVKQLTASLGFYGRDSSVAKRLLIISDVLMNSGPAVSYKENLSDPKAKAARAYIREFIPTLVNCEVTIGLLARHNHRHRQTKEQLRWFEAYLREGGATAVSYEDLR